MWNIIAKFILVVTSFAPLLCAIAIDSVSKPWRISVIYLFVAGIVLGIIDKYRKELGDRLAAVGGCQEE